MPKILVADKLSSGGLDILKEAGLDVDVKTGMSEDELVEAAPPYEGIIVRSAAQITKRIIDAAPKLKLVGRAGVGVDNIDLDAATSSGVVVMNTPLGNITSAAEQALALMMSLMRHTPAADASMKSGEWNKKKFTGSELSGKTMGIIGLGKIGRIVNGVCQALGMKVLVHDPYINQKMADEIDVELRELESLLKDADVVSLHVPLNDSTRGIINAERLGMMKKTARLVNCARGGVVDEEALADAMTNGTIAGAAIDVFAAEPLPEDSPLRNLPNVILTPHLGASTTEAQERVSEDLAKQFVDFFEKDEIRNPVNLAVTLKPHLAPFAQLAETLGRFASQTSRGGVEMVNCACYGEIGKSSEDAHVLSVLAMQGVLGSQVDTKVNLVNVSRIAESRGIELNERRSEKARTYKNIVSVEVGAGEKGRKVYGAVFEGNEVRIVRIDDFDIDVRPAPWMLLMAYPDKPGMVGKFGTILGDAGINIAGMSVGRREKSGVAVVVLTIDDPVADDVLDKVGEAIDAVELYRIEL